jgi:hypothetical protein
LISLPGEKIPAFQFGNQQFLSGVSGQKLPIQGEIPMAKPNYSFEKRKKELDRQKKKDEKKARKGEQNADGTEQEAGADEVETATVAE